MAEAPEEIADELYGAPFEEFIARRDAAARELRRAKRRDEADAVKALRKPALSAWAIDQLARRDRDRIDGLLAAGAALRQARGGDTLRDATHDERSAVDDAAERAAEILREAGHPLSAKTTSELRDTLHAVALDGDTRALVERGRLVEPRAVVGFGLGAVPAPASGASKPKRDRAKAKPARDDSRAAQRKSAAAARSALRDAEKAERERERELAAAESALDAAQRAADAARDALDEAREVVEQRRAALDDA